MFINSLKMRRRVRERQSFFYNERMEALNTKFLNSFFECKVCVSFEYFD